MARRAAATVFACMTIGCGHPGPDVRNSFPLRPSGDRWVTGVVRDDAGQPIAGATVYGSGLFHGAMRTGEIVTSATTDAGGRYTLGDATEPLPFEVTVVVNRPGRVPALDVKSIEDDHRPTCDLLLTNRGGQLDVAATTDGRPSAGTTVRLERSGGRLHDQWSMLESGPGRESVKRRIEEIAFPVRTTDAAGIAHFDTLEPGLYDVRAAGGPAGRQWSAGNAWDESLPEGVPAATASGLAVRDGIRTAFNLPLFVYEPMYSDVTAGPSARAVRPDGRPMTGESVRFASRAVGDHRWHEGSTSEGVTGTNGLLLLGLGSSAYWRCDAFGLSELAIAQAADGSGRPFDDASRPTVVAGGYLARSGLLKVGAIPTFVGRDGVTSPLSPNVTAVAGSIPDATEYEAVPAELSGRVVLADGVTPARFADITCFGRGCDRASVGGQTDAAGHLRTRSLPIWFAVGQQPSRARGALVIARVPGSIGATVLRPAGRIDGTVSIVLPSARSARGRVTLGGRSPADLHAQLRLRAVYQGDDWRVDDVLSIWATPQPDGRFELAGLTPGDYLVQAAVDNIWLSASVPMHVAADRDPSELSLDVPTPEGPVAVTVVDAAGRPVVGRRVTVDRPAGPLTAACWPDHFTTDGAGVAYVPALETGPHVVHVGRQTVVVNPPALPCEGPTLARCVVPADDE